MPPPSDLDVYRSANIWFQRHGDDATAKAREMVEAMRRKAMKTVPTLGCGSLRTIVAIGALGESPTGARPQRARLACGVLLPLPASVPSERCAMARSSQKLMCPAPAPR